jgi:membrane-associated protein
MMLAAGSPAISATTLYAYLVLFATVVVEGPIATVVAGVLVALGRLDWRIALPLIIIADLVGDTGYYALGYWSRHPLLAWIRQRLGLSDARLAPLERSFARHSGLLLISAKWSHFMGVPALVAAGLGRLPYPRFLGYSILATVPKSTMFLVLGVVFGNQAVVVLQHYLAIGSVVGLVVSGIVVLLVLVGLPRLVARHLKTRTGEG